MNRKALFAALAIAALPQAGHAAEIIGSRGDWQMFENDKSCGMTRTYEGSGETEIMVIKYADGSIRIMITNAAWSAKQDKQYDISYVVNGTSYGGAKAIGTADQTRKGFVSTFVAAFGQDFAKGSVLQVLLAGQEIERLSLNGSGAAMTAIDQCLASLRAVSAADEREKAKRAQLPKDPFATAPKTPPPKGKRN